jgi:hypothetical protein
MSDDRIARVAFHEAGHAVIGSALALPISYATVRPFNDWAGHVMFASNFVNVGSEPHLLLTLAGPVAEQRQFPTAPRLDHSIDMRGALAIIRVELWSANIERDGLRKAKGPAPADIDAELAKWQKRTSSIVDQHWSWIVIVAERLQKLTGLTGGEIIALRPVADSMDAPLATSPISTANALYGSAA